VESRQEIDENVEMENEPPNKRRKTYDNSNETAPCQSSFIGAALLSSLSNIFTTSIEALIMTFWCCCILTSYDLVYGLNQFRISWLTLVLDKLDKMKINKESSDSDIQECIDLGLGSIELMVQYNRLTNLKRKEVHRPDLEQDYHLKFLICITEIRCLTFFY
jgi:hypothetical protein